MCSCPEGSRRDRLGRYLAHWNRQRRASRVSGERRGFGYGLEGAYQVGKARGDDASSTAPIAAFALAGHVQQTFREALGSPTLRLAGSYASGRKVGQRAVGTNDPLVDGALLIGRGLGRAQMYVSGSVTAESATDATLAEALDRMEAALAARG